MREITDVYCHERSASASCSTICRNDAGHRAASRCNRDPRRIYLSNSPSQRCAARGRVISGAGPPFSLFPLRSQAREMERREAPGRVGFNAPWRTLPRSAQRRCGGALPPSNAGGQAPPGAPTATLQAGPRSSRARQRRCRFARRPSSGSRANRQVCSLYVPYQATSTKTSAPKLQRNEIGRLLRFRGQSLAAGPDSQGSHSADRSPGIIPP